MDSGLEGEDESRALDGSPDAYWNRLSFSASHGNMRLGVLLGVWCRVVGDPKLAGQSQYNTESRSS